MFRLNQMVKVDGIDEPGQITGQSGSDFYIVTWEKAPYTMWRSLVIHEEEISKMSNPSFKLNQMVLVEAIDEPGQITGLIEHHDVLCYIVTWPNPPVEKDAINPFEWRSMVVNSAYIKEIPQQANFGDVSNLLYLATLT